MLSCEVRSRLGPTPCGWALLADGSTEVHALDVGEAHLTWSEGSQALEDDLTRAHNAAHDDRRALVAELERVQERTDSAPITSDEWNVLYRLRLQMEQEATRSSRR